MKVLIVTVNFVILTHLYGAFDYTAINTQSAGLANSNLASTTSPGAFLINPALSVNSKNLYGSLNYFQLFNLKSLTYSSGQIAFSFHTLHLGLGIQSFGDNVYRENKITINSSRKFIDKKLAIGLSLNAYNISVENYGNINSFGMDIGLRFSMTPNWSLGGVIENINQPKLNGYDEELPNRVQLGFEYKIMPQLISNIAVQKDAWFSPAVLFGIEYSLSNALEISSGFSSAANLPSGGIGLNILNIEINYSVQYHFALGPTHFVGITYNPAG